MERDKEEIIKLIKLKQYRQSINLIYKNIEERLKEKLKIEKNLELKEQNFIDTLDYAIKEFKNEYELLTYIRNSYLLSENNDEEKLYELLEIYKIFI